MVFNVIFFGENIVKNESKCMRKVEVLCLISWEWLSCKEKNLMEGVLIKFEE